MPDVGQPVPEFSGRSTRGDVSSAALKGRRYVLYFFPRAFTAG